MLKKFFIGIILIVVLVVNCLPFNVQAEEIELSSPSVILMEANGGEILYEKNCDEARSIASITKVMTLLLTMEALENGSINLEQKLTASLHASSMGGSDIWLKEGEQMSVDDLIKATVIMSANDAAVVLAEEIAGTEDAFVAMMNSKASELGMTGTVFKNCNGLDEDGHLSTARDIAIMSRELVKYEQITNYTLTWIDNLRNGETQLVNTNKLINSYKGITGLKTGTTSTAGSCISATASRNGLDLIAVVLGASDTKTRFKEASSLLDYGFSNWALISPEYELPQEIKVGNAMKDFVKFEIKSTPQVVAKVSEKPNVQCLIELNENIVAPVNVADELGFVKVYVGNELRQKVPIIASENIDEISIMKVIEYFLSKFVM